MVGNMTCRHVRECYIGPTILFWRAYARRLPIHPMMKHPSAMKERRRMRMGNRIWLTYFSAPNTSNDEAAAREDDERGDGRMNLGVFSAQI